MSNELQELENRLQADIKRLNTLKCERSLAEFTKQAWHIIEPGTPLLWNWHLDTLCGYLEATMDKCVHLTRLIINIPPGSLKSVLVSVMYPAWMWIKNPQKRILGVSNAQDLAIRDSRRTKQIITDEWFTEQWPLDLKADQSAKTNYENVAGGFRVSLGITANITGKRGDCVILDDPHDASTAQSDLIRKSVLEIYDTKLSTRVNSQQHSVIILIMQRLHAQDLTGHLLLKKKTKWTHVVMPMHYDKAYTFDAGKDLGRPELNDPRKDDELLFPGLFPKDTVEKLEEDMGTYASAGQLEQRPSPKGGGILREEWFRVLDETAELPVCDHIFISCDTAYSEKDMKDNSYSAFTTWGVFWNKAQQRDCVLLLDVWFGQVDYPELRRHAHKVDKDKKPDVWLIEKKASGQSLVQDLRQSGLLVRTYVPTTDKVSRAYAIQPMLESGQVWIPDRKWAKAFAYKMGTFPTGDPVSFDLADTCTQALLYIRNGMYVSHPDDLEHDRPEVKRVSAYGAHSGEIDEKEKVKSLVADEEWRD